MWRKLATLNAPQSGLANHLLLFPLNIFVTFSPERDNSSFLPPNQCFLFRVKGKERKGKETPYSLCAKTGFGKSVASFPVPCFGDLLTWVRRFCIPAAKISVSFPCEEGFSANYGFCFFGRSVTQMRGISSKKFECPCSTTSEPQSQSFGCDDQSERVMHGNRWLPLHIRVLSLGLMLRSMIFELRRALAVDGFSIELHQKKRQAFGLSEVKVESRSIWFTVWKSARRRIGSNTGVAEATLVRSIIPTVARVTAKPPKSPRFADIHQFEQHKRHETISEAYVGFK